MPDKAQDWSLAYNDAGNVILICGGERINLGPRDEAFVRMADFMGEDLAAKFVVPASGGVAG